MADYFNPTIVDPSIPCAAMTPLERLLLSHIFSAEPDGEALYFFAETGADDLPCIARADLVAALGASAEPSRTADFVRRALAANDGALIDLDLTLISWDFIFQDIVRRSATLAHVIVLQAFTCSKMRPDGFGGMAMLITADAVRCKSTNEIVEEFLAAAEGASAAAAPAIEVTVRVQASAVRETVAGVLEAEAPGERLQADAVTDDDILAGCQVVQNALDLSEQASSATFSAALAAIRCARERLGA